jgi:sugar lactone lactonase YvrE
MKRLWLAIGFALSCVIILGGSLGVAAQESSGKLTATLLVSGLEGGSGSTVGPDSALYVPEDSAGRITRIDPQTGEKTVFASGLPKMMVENWEGGIMDVAFINDTAYALVTLVSPDVGGKDIDGIYRIDGPNKFTVVADIGKWSTDHPPVPAFEVPTGVQYAMDIYQGNFIVTDGHHNRVLKVTPDGEISQLITFDDIVPTGLEVSATDDTIFVTEAGPVPHLPENGKVMKFKLGDSTATEVASGAPLLIDVEYGSDDALYALAQGYFAPGNQPGTPAQPNTGSLVRVNPDGKFTVVADGLNQPTSLEIIGDTAYVITLNGEIWKVKGV